MHTFPNATKAAAREAGATAAAVGERLQRRHERRRHGARRDQRDLAHSDGAHAQLALVGEGGAARSQPRLALLQERHRPRLARSGAGERAARLHEQNRELRRGVEALQPLDELAAQRERQLGREQRAAGEADQELQRRGGVLRLPRGFATAGELPAAQHGGMVELLLRQLGQRQPRHLGQQRPHDGPPARGRRAVWLRRLGQQGLQLGREAAGEALLAR